LIRAIALLHQYQREVKHTTVRGQKVSYIEVSRDDIALANAIATEVLGASLDELAPQTRKLLELIEEMVREICERRQVTRSEVTFTRRQIREHAGWSLTQVRLHLERLVEHELVFLYGGGRGQPFFYELAIDSSELERTVPALLDPDALAPAAGVAPAAPDATSGAASAPTTAVDAATTPSWRGGGGGGDGGVTGGGKTKTRHLLPSDDEEVSRPGGVNPTPLDKGKTNSGPSYAHAPSYRLFPRRSAEPDPAAPSAPSEPS